MQLVVPDLPCSGTRTPSGQWRHGARAVEEASELHRGAAGTQRNLGCPSNMLLPLGDQELKGGLGGTQHRPNTEPEMRQRAKPRGRHALFPEACGCSTGMSSPLGLVVGSHLDLALTCLIGRQAPIPYGACLPSLVPLM